MYTSEPAFLSKLTDSTSQLQQSLRNVKFETKLFETLLSNYLKKFDLGHTNQNARQNTNKFRNIVEAYKVLGKADSRAVYDTVMLQQGEYTKYSSFKRIALHCISGWDPRGNLHLIDIMHRLINFPFYRNAVNSSQHPNTTGAYYGAFGSKRISNKTIVFYCMVFMIVGAIIQALAIKFSVTLGRDKLDRVSMEAGKVHSRARANAEEYGNDHQIKKLIQKVSDVK